MVPRTIRRVLVAARGDDAAQVVAALEAGGVEAVAVFGEEDAESPHLDVASWQAPLVRAPRLDDALLPDDIVAAALDAGADAVHPGTGPGRDDPALARAVTLAGLAWIGAPGPRAADEAPDARALVMVVLRDAAGASVVLGAHLVLSGAAFDPDLTVAPAAVSGRRAADPVAVDRGAAGVWTIAWPADGRGPAATRAGLVPGWAHHRVAGQSVPLAEVRLFAGDAAIDGTLGASAAEEEAWVEATVRAASDGVAGVVQGLDGVVVAVDQPVRRGQVLARPRFVGPTAHVALVRARAALEAASVQGADTNLPELVATLSDPSVWRLAGAGTLRAP